jgi:iron-sulfur cluster repair protein YtfE (RIC family)
MEEKYIFPILGNDNILIKQAIEEHKILTSLFCNTAQIETSLKQILIDLEKHIRFEERVLFNAIQKVALPKNLEAIKKLHANNKLIDNITDIIWK